MAYWYINGGNGSTTGYYAVPVWGTGAKTVGQFRRQLTVPTVGNERCFVCIVAGTSGGVEPTWVVTAGAKTVDGTVTWMECTGQPGTCGSLTNTAGWALGAVTLGTLIKGVSNSSTRLFICTTAGTISGAEPTWIITAGGLTTSGTAVFTHLGLASIYTAFQNPFARLLPVINTFRGAGDIQFVADNHAETQTGFITYNIINPPSQTYCVDHTVATPGSANLKTTATITCTTSGITINGRGYFYGLNFIASVGGINLQQSAQYVVFEACTFTSAANLAISAADSMPCGICELNNSSIMFSGTSNRIRVNGGVFNWRNSLALLPATNLPAAALSAVGNCNVINCEGVDFSIPPYWVRDSVATYFDATGTLQTAAINELRNNTYNPITLASLGTLTESASTNFVPNNSSVGEVPGTPGTLATNWIVQLATGTTRQTNASGIENGIPYSEIRISGTPTTVSMNFFFCAYNVTPTVVGDIWTNSAYIKLVAGSWANVTLLRLGIQEFNAAGGNTINYVGNITAPTSADLATQHYTFTHAIGQATTAFTRSYLQLVLTTGAAIDFTVRICSQYELAAAASSLIITSGTAVTRAADLFVTDLTVVDSVPVGARVALNGCLYSSANSPILPPIAGAWWVDAIQCDNANNYSRNERWRWNASQTTELTIIRNGGASDGITPISWKINAIADDLTLGRPFNIMPITIWNAVVGTPITATLEIISDGLTLTDADIWLEVVYFGSAASPLGAFINNGLVNLLGTATAWPTSTASWVTTGLASPSKQKIAITLTPQHAGFITIYPRLSASVATIFYLDPKVALS